ncbi:MAG: helix-turn-helix domain-containing protein [Gammaproteobacteria bacterium]|nr:helix-turn-helix domain-containing protein [Gammaproteobacteria bacterium]
MLAFKQNTLTLSFLGFASEASNILHIKTEKDYAEALETIEHLFTEAKDENNDPLNDLIDIISRAIEEYELSQESIVNFHKDANNINQEISVLRVLIEQHNLTLSAFKDEIGSKSLVSMILNGKRNLTKEHIAKLSERFNLSPAIFFNLRAI